MPAAPSEATAAGLIEKLAAGDRRALGRAISIVESKREQAAELVREAFPRVRSAPIVGITGPSGAGKSTLVDGLTSIFRQEGATVGVLEEGAGGFIYIEEIVNFLISGMVAWWGWVQGSRELQRRLRR